MKMNIAAVMTIAIFLSLSLIVSPILVLAAPLRNPDSSTLRGAALVPQASDSSSSSTSNTNMGTTPPSWWNICTVGDITSEKVLIAVKNYASCSIIVLLGDYYDKESKFVGGFKQPGVPVLAACGNHDDCDNVARNDNIAGDALNYGFRWKDTGFLILNTDESIGSQKAKAELLMKRWQNDSSIKHIVVAQHKVAITTPDAHHKESELKGYRTFFTDMQAKYPKFQVLLQGHNHFWQSCTPDKPPLLVITDGTGGRKPYPLGDKANYDDGCNAKTAISGNNYDGFTVINLNGPTGKIEFQHYNIGK